MIHRFALLIFALPLIAQVQVIKETNQPAEIREQLWIIPGGWTNRIPALGNLNAPGHLDEVVPGQSFQVALVAAGDDRDGREKLLADRVLNLRISTSAGAIEKRELKLVALRSIKADGTDMMFRLLEAGGIKEQDRETLEQKTSMVSIAVFDPAWETPPLTKVENIEVEATVTGGMSPFPKIRPAKLKFRPWSDWQGGPEMDQTAMGRLMSGFHESPKPGLLIPLLKGAARSRGLGEHSVYAFFIAAFREYPAAKQEAIRALPSFDPLNKWALLMVLRLGGDDISGMMGGLPDDAQASLKEAQPLKDPRAFIPFKDPVDPQAAGGIGVPMDQCWGEWMATGDPSYLRALVGLLNGAADFPDLEAWKKAKGGSKGLNARVEQGLAYQIAGWSISSFQRTDPQVADWLLYWQQDPSLSETIRVQIKGLSDNKAFQSIE